MVGQQSDATPGRSNRRPMTLVHENEIPDPPPTPTTASSITSSTASPTRTDVQELLSRAAWRAGVIGALTIATRILAARAILMLAMIGAIGLAVMALIEGDYLRLAVLATYLIGCLAPLVWLSSRS